MITERGDKEYLKLKSTREVFLQSLYFINSIDKNKLLNIYYELTRTTNIRDVDLDYVFRFLDIKKYIQLEDEVVILSKTFNPEKIIIDLCNYYLSLLLSNKEINAAIFINSDFTISNDNIILNRESIPLAYRPYLLVLQRLNLIESVDTSGFTVTNYIIAKKLLERPLKKISPEDFEKDQERKRLFGIEAEKFVLKFEKKRLKNKKLIDWVAERVVNEGYDISSFNSIEDERPNRFIEVKSYDGNVPYFYWSQNEYQVAKQQGYEYWIYLVNRSDMIQKDYSPIQIQNPFVNVLRNLEWIKEVDSYKLSAKR
jgi:hypothetical protein